jgi:O-antigen ligase
VPPQLALLISLALSAWLIYRDQEARDVDLASWVPTFWVLILASRPLSTWFGLGGTSAGYEYSVEGSPVDRLGFLLLIAAAFAITVQRRVQWSLVISRNKMLFVFYLYLLISVLWASSSLVSFKRWLKDFGDIVVAMVILSDEHPVAVFKTVFIRCACLLIPLSLVFIRYFPDLGRRYNVHSGLMEATGVTFQKNSLGAMVLVSGLILMWDLSKRLGRRAKGVKRVELLLLVGVLLIGAYLLWVSDSKTATLCLAIGGGIILSERLPLLQQHTKRFVPYSIIAVLGFFVLVRVFNIQELVLQSLGRDTTFTGRTDVWQTLLNLKTNPIIGTGFCDIWSNASYRKLMPDWVAFSAHNGYVEMYLDGGMVGVGLLVLMLLAVASKINRHLQKEDDYAILRFSVLLITAIYNFSESIYGRISPGWFVFLLVALDYHPSRTRVPAPSRNKRMRSRQNRNNKHWSASVNSPSIHVPS